MESLKEKHLTLKYLLAMTIADVDIFLLMDETQERDNNKEYFTREEIRHQLQKTLSKVTNAMNGMGYNIDKPDTYFCWRTCDTCLRA